MEWSLTLWIAVVLGGLAVFLLVQFIWLFVVITWSEQQSAGIGYFGRSPAGRERFRLRLRRHAFLLTPILRLVGRFSSFTFERASFRHAGISGPRGTCSEESFAHGAAYVPRPEDIFVVTQMKCGTTWMQQLVHEVLCRGEGDLVESGTALYAVSPWLEGLKGVAIEEAPLISTDRPSRIIKTHFPVDLCPFDPRARYIYVARHPVSCFASCADFLAATAGALAPDLDVVEAWFCSDEEMWWGPWTDHVDGWWNKAAGGDNALFVTFEEMKSDLPVVVDRIAAFLGVPELGDDARANVVRKSSFDYMRRHNGAFEMRPPHVFAIDGELFVRGSADRHRDVPADVGRRIAAWSAAGLRDGHFPLERIYPDVAATTA